MPEAVSVIRKLFSFNAKSAVYLMGESVKRRQEVNDLLATFFSDALDTWRGAAPFGLDARSCSDLAAFLHGETGQELDIESESLVVTIAKRMGGGLEVISVTFSLPTLH